MVGFKERKKKNETRFILRICKQRLNRGHRNGVRFSFKTSIDSGHVPLVTDFFFFFKEEQQHTKQQRVGRSPLFFLCVCGGGEKEKGKKGGKRRILCFRFQMCSENVTRKGGGGGVGELSKNSCSF